MCACDQWSTDPLRRPTLVRHATFLSAGIVGLVYVHANPEGRAPPLTPAPRSLGMGLDATRRTLVAACRLTSSHITSPAPTRTTAVEVAAVAAAAQHDLDAAPRTQEQAGWTVHTHPRSSRRCWTDSSQRATLAWHRLHRHGVGRGPVFRLPGKMDRCRAHLLRHQRCCIQSAAINAPPSWGRGTEITSPTRLLPVASASRRRRPRHVGRPSGRPTWRKPSNQTPG